MDKQKQIEEMAKVKIGAILEKVNMGDGYADIDSLADEIYHITIPENAVVLTREEYGSIVTRPSLNTAIDVFEVRKETAEELDKWKRKAIFYYGLAKESGIYCVVDDEICKEIAKGNK